MNKYEIRTEKKKMLILQSALSLFRERGFVAVSVKEIATLAGVSQVSIYNYFKGKDALVKECVNHLMQEEFTEARSILYKDGNYKDKLFKAFEACTNATCRLLAEYFSSEALQDKVFLDLYTEGTKQLKIELYCEYIEFGRREGMIDSSISQESIISFMKAMEHIELPHESLEDMKKREIEIQKLILFGLIGK